MEIKIFTMQRGLVRPDIENVKIISCSSDAFVDTGSENPQIRNLLAESNNKNDITMISSSTPNFTDITTTGSLGYGMDLQATVSASLNNTFLSKEGSGSLRETGTKFTQLSLAREQNVLLDLAIGKAGTPSFGKRLSLIDSSGIWGRDGAKFFKQSAGLDIFQIIDTDSPVIWISGQQDAATGGGTDVHAGLTFGETRENPDYDWQAYLEASGTAALNNKINEDFAQIAFIGVNANDVFDNAIDPTLSTPQLESASIELRGALLFDSDVANRVFNQPLWYSVSLLSGSHNFYGDGVTFNCPVTFAAGGGINEASQSFVIELADRDPAGAASGTWLEFRKIDALAAGPPDYRIQNAAWYYDDVESVVKFAATRSLFTGTPADDANGDPEGWTSFMSMSVGTGQAHFSGSKFRVAQLIESQTGFTGSFTGEFEGKVPSGSTVIHDLVDLGIQSSSFTASFNTGNVKKFTAGGDLNVAIENTLPGGVYLLEINNSGNHTVTFPGVLWSQGIVDTVSSGSNLVNITEISIGTLVTIVGKDIS